jgi:Thioredoxin like C-terminal domain/AhpC/TSA family
MEEEMFERTRGGAADLPVEGEFPDLGGATAWLNSEPLTPAGLRGKVVLVEFCTYSCVNWLRTVPYVRAWDERYRDDGLVVIGAHTPEFEFEHDVEKIRAALEEMGVRYPIAVDNDYAVWRAFDNNYWPALYFADARGQIRHHRFGEEDYERSERVIQELLTAAGASGVDEELVSVDADGIYAPADWETLGSPETYVGYARASAFASPGGLVPEQSHVYDDPPKLDLNHWSLGGDWTVGEQPTLLNEPGGRIRHRFHAGDVNLVMGAEGGEGSVPFVVRVDGEPPGDAHGLDVDAEGNGTVAEERLYQLVRQPGSDSDRTFEITFQGSGVQAYVFTFG